uniref:Olfactory receptor n=1 Tax=Pyxicephalus adspersus TaxID=30357 RepID=A0AAV2ZE86_PYXAD|nr:TPA: hypothetical protein GDO54_005191 [Pyxicephalus adspersus]
MTNHCNGIKLLLLGITDTPSAQAPMFLIFLIIYLLTVLGNLIIVTVICVNHELHNPMYFFIGNLAILDIFYSSVTQPQLLSILITGPSLIAFHNCIAQLYVFMSLACTEFVSLTAMAYDRYVAICKPLHYSVLMNRRVYLQLAIICWVAGFLDPLAHTVVISRLPICKSPILNHFYCDLSLLLSLSCVDKILIEIMTYIVGSVVAVPAFLLTLVSYVFIISTVLNINSPSGRRKAFSTCTSHLTVVTLFYGTVLAMHMRPSSDYLLKHDKPLSVLYTAVIPMMNPLIYSFRNNNNIPKMCKQIKKKKKEVC